MIMIKDVNTTPVKLINHINDLILLMNTFTIHELREDITSDEICAISYLDKFTVPQSHANKSLFSKQLEVHLSEHPNKRLSPGAKPRIKIMDQTIYVQVNLRVLFERGDLSKHNLYHFMRRTGLVSELDQDWEYFIDLYMELDLTINETIKIFKSKLKCEPAGKKNVQSSIERWLNDNPNQQPKPAPIGVSVREFRDNFVTTTLSAKIHHNQVIDTSVSDLAETLLSGEQSRLRVDVPRVYLSAIEYYTDSPKILTVERTITWVKNKKQ